MAGLIGKPRRFHKKYKFIVEFKGVEHVKFRKCSELSSETAKSEQNEGGTLIPDKGFGRVTFTDVTLERGAADDDDMWNWYQAVSDAEANSGGVEEDVKRNGDIVQQQRDNKTLHRWRLTNAWPLKFVAGDWDNDSDDNVIEQVTLTYDFFKKVKA